MRSLVRGTTTSHDRDVKEIMKKFNLTPASKQKTPTRGFNQLDYIFVSDNFGVKDFETEPKSWSDHMELIAELKCLARSFTKTKPPFPRVEKTTYDKLIENAFSNLIPKDVLH